MTDRIIIADLSEDEQATFDKLYEQLDAKAGRNLLRASYYDGKRAIRQVGTVIPPQYYRLGIALGWSAMAVDRFADRCNLERFVWPDGDLDSLGVDDVWGWNSFDAELPSALISALIHGVSFLVTTRGDESKGEPLALIHVKDAMNATGEWNPRTRRLDNLLSVTGRDKEGKLAGFALYLPNLTVTAEKSDGVWEIDRQEHPWGVPAEPVVHQYRVGRPFGTSRISRDVMSLHDSALRAVIRMEGHMDVYSFPEFWLLGADESIFKNADGTQKASWQVMLGRIKGIPDDDDAAVPRAEVHQFSAASPEPHLTQLNAIAKQFARATSLPDSSFALTDYANPTAEGAYEASREDLIAAVENATGLWSVPVQNAMNTALAIANGLDAVPDEWKGKNGIKPDWRSPLFLSRAAKADAGMKTIAAVPWLAETEVGLELLGLDDQQIRRALADRRRAEGRGVLQALRDAAQQAQMPQQAPPDANAG